MATILGVLLAFNIFNYVSLNILHKDLATINGYGLLEVASGSMEPTLHIGDLIVIDTKDLNYQERDIITFYDTEGSFVTHRIEEIKDTEVITKGDNNSSIDPAISKDVVVGKWVLTIPGLGLLLKALKTPFVSIMILIIGILFCILVSTEDTKLSKEEEKEFAEYSEEMNSVTKNTGENI